jgi:hypothetical protein
MSNKKIKKGPLMKQSRLPRPKDKNINTNNDDLGIGKFCENDFGLTKQEAKWLNNALQGYNGEKPTNLFTLEEEKILRKVERQERRQERKKQQAYEKQETFFHDPTTRIEGNASAFFLKVVHNVIPDTDMKKINLRFLDNHAKDTAVVKGNYREHLLALAQENSDFNNRQASPGWYGFGAVDHRSVWELDCDKAEDILAPTKMQENDYALVWNLRKEEDHPQRVRNRTFGGNKL